MDPLSLGATLIPAVLGGGGGRTSVSQSSNTSISFAPVLAQQVGGGSGISANPSTYANGSVPSYATSAGNDNASDPSRYLSTSIPGVSSYQPALYGDPTIVNRPASVNGAAQEDNSMLMLLLLIGGGVALLFLGK